jgi:hypothetical protein
MMKNVILIIAMACLTGCSTAQPTPEVRSVRGVLQFYPSNVKSVQAWYGHNFMVDGTPILPTDQVPEDVLKKFVGKLVTVQGVWQPGKQWKPSEEEKVMQMPVDPDKEVVIVGDGLRATMIALVER